MKVICNKCAEMNEDWPGEMYSHGSLTHSGYVLYRCPKCREKDRTASRGVPKHRAIIVVSRELLMQSLSLPADAQMIEIRSNPDQLLGEVEIVLEHPDLPEVWPGWEYTRMNPVLRTHRTPAEFVSWG